MKRELKCEADDGTVLVVERVSPVGFRLYIKDAPTLPDGTTPCVYLKNEDATKMTEGL